MEKTFFSTPELAKWLGVFHTTARRWIEQDKIKGVRVGRNYKIPIEEAIRVLEDYKIPLPEILEEYNLKKKREAAGLSRRPGPSGSTVLQKLLIVEEIEDPALVCRRGTILGANQVFADLVGHTQADLIGVDIAEVMDASARDKLIEFAGKPEANSGKRASGYWARLKTEKTPTGKARINVGSLDHMKGVFLLIVLLSQENF